MDPPSSISVPDSPAALPPPPPPPPTPSHHRRPRVREVSSRFMSPVVSSALPRRHHHHNHRHQQQLQPEVDSLNSSDENSRPIENSESTPFSIGSSVSHCKGNLVTSTTTAITSTAQRKQRVVKLFKENNSYNGGGGRDPSRSCSGRIGIGIGIGNGFGGGGGGSSRPDTPTVVVVPSRYRLTPHHKAGSSGSGNVSAAAKLLQASGMSLKGNNAGSGLSETNSVSGDASSVCSDDECHSDSDVSRSIQSLPELCSDGDVLPTVSNRSVAEKIVNRGVLSCSSSSSSNSNSNGDLKFHASSPLHRSISLPSPSPGGDNLLVHSLKGSEKQTPSMSKLYGNQSNHVKVGGGGGGLGLPPVPPCAKPVAETRKGNKGSSPQENVHCLRLMYNRYLQWRYANAKAVSAMKVQKRESEKALYSHAMKISEMRDSVSRKRVELELLRRSRALSTILEAQIPYLDEWSALEEDYSISITEATQALVNASVQLPVGGNARVEVRELGEALNSALKMMETIVFNIQELMPEAEETEVSISELARVVGGERALIGDCGDLLSKTYKSQVEECSLRGQLIQLHSTCHKNKITEQRATDNSIAICEGNEHTLVSS